MKIGKIISSILQDKKRIIKILGLGKSDVQTCNEVAPYGIDSNPIKDMVAIMSPTSEMGRTVIIGYINKNQVANVGELRLFSTDENGVEKMFVYLKNDGELHLGSDVDNLVRYSALEEAFNDLKDFVNLHVHGTAGTPPTTQTTANISGAKIEEIKSF